MKRVYDFLRGTWVIYLLIVYTVVVTVLFVRYDNPNKFLLEPRYDYHYGAISLGQLNQAIEMALKEPFLPVTGSVTGDFHMMDAEIEFYLPKPITYYGQLLHFSLFKSQKIPFDLADRMPSPKYKRYDYNFPEYKNKKVAGFKATMGGTVKLEEGSATVTDQTQLELIADYPKSSPECTDQTDWELKFKESDLQLVGPESSVLKAMRFSHLVADACHKTVMMELPKSVYVELQAKNQLIELQSQFADKFKKSYPGTPLCVLDWSYNMMNGISHWDEKQDINFIIVKVLTDQKRMMNGTAYSILGYRQLHNRYLTKTFILLVVWLALVACAVIHYRILGQQGRKAELKKMILSPWLIPIDLAVNLANDYRQVKLNIRELREQRIAEKAKAKKLRAKAEEEARQRQDLQELVQQEKLKREIAEAAEAKALQARLETSAQEFLARYKSMSPDSILNHPGVDNGVAERLKSVWQSLEKIPDGESIMDNPTNSELLDDFKQALAAAQGKINAYQAMVLNLQLKLAQIQNLDPMIRSRFTTQTRESLCQQAEKLQNPRLKPRDLRQVEYVINKIIESHTLSV